MKKRIVLVLAGSHVLAMAAGFAAGIYVLPLLTAPPAPTRDQIGAAASSARYKATFRRDLEGSDRLHWGEGVVSIGPEAVVLDGKLAPGPDYKLYLSPEFVETEADFLRVRPGMVRIGEVRTFEGFIVPLPPHVDPAGYNTVIVWCESFGQFITAGKYR